MSEIGDKLRELRERNNLTRKEAIDKLRTLGIDISDKTLYGYESGRNSTNADMFLALCKIYNCINISSEFSNTSEDVIFTNSEWELIEKYRKIEKYSPRGKESVDYILDREYGLAKEISEKEAVKDNVVEYSAAPVAAHNDHADEPGELEKMQYDISSLKRPE